MNCIKHQFLILAFCGHMGHQEIQECKLCGFISKNEEPLFWTPDRLKEEEIEQLPSYENII